MTSQTEKQAWYLRAILWLGQQVATVCVSATIGAGVALAVDAYLEAQQGKFFVIGDDNGIAYPAVLFDNAADEGTEITFKPKELKQIRVCEYTHDRGRTWTELMYNYLKEYKQCFVVRRLGENSLEISPNTFAGFLDRDGESGEYRCKCM